MKIVPELHKIQHHFGYLPDGQLRAMAERLAVPLHRLHEVASFFPHFRLTAPPDVEIGVCRDMACHLHGAAQCRRALEALASEGSDVKVHVGGVSCLGQCDGAPAVTINDQVYWRRSQQELETLVRGAMAGKPLPRQTANRDPLGWRIDPYNGAPR